MPLPESERNKLYAKGIDAYRLGNLDEAIRIIKLLKGDAELRESIHRKEQIRANSVQVHA